MPATLSMMGLMEYDSTLLDDMTFPEGLDPAMVKSAIIMACAPFEVLIPQPELCKQWLKYFSLRRAKIWDKLYQSTVQEYNILSDSDYTETVNETENTTRTPDMTTEGQNGGSDTVEEQVSAFNSDDYANRQKQTTTLGSTNKSHTSGTDTTERTREDTRSQTGRHTSAAELLQKEREAAIFDVVQFIADDVKANFCIMVY